MQLLDSQPNVLAFSMTENALPRRSLSLDWFDLILDDIPTGRYLVMSKASDPELVKLLTESFSTVLDRRESN